MVAASTLRKIRNDIDAIATRMQPAFAVSFLKMPQRMERFKDRILARHRELFPAEGGADLFVFATIYEDKPGSKLPPLNPSEGDTTDKHQKAWRSVARELIEAGELKQ